MTTTAEVPAVNGATEKGAKKRPITPPLLFKPTHPIKVQPKDALPSPVLEARSKRLKINASQLGGDPSEWLGKSILSVEQFSLEALELVFRHGDEMRELVAKRGGDTRLRGRILGTLFFENSTRTCCSFQAAMARLGGVVMAVNESTSSVKKGETLEDTVVTLQTYCDVLSIRHPQKGAVTRAVGIGVKPILNAGDGIGEHPTQALLDMYTIHCELGGIEGKVVTMLGDLKHGRTVHSLAKLLALYKCEIHYVSPESLAMPPHITEYVSSKGMVTGQHNHNHYNEILSKTDVLYVTRIQKERFPEEAEYEAVRGCFCVTPEVLAKAKKDMILMHPLPRVGEISEACDEDPRAAYFRQMENGMLVRMGLLSLICPHGA
ncbi:unnamed protein product [Chrysoparadoxa australica]